MEDEPAGRRSFLKQVSMLAAASLFGKFQAWAGQMTASGAGTSSPPKVALLTEPGAPHLDIYLDCMALASGIQEVAVGDTSGEIFEKAKQKLSEKFGSPPFYTDFDRLYQEQKPDLVILSFPANDAPAAIEAALKHGCHVLAEKPACVRVADFERLTKLAEKQRRNLMLAFATRMNPLVIRARELVRNGALGKLYGASMYFLADQTRLRSPAYQRSWVASKKTAGGGHLIWLGIHYVDVIQFISGQRISKVCGFIENAGGQPLDVEDSAAVSMQFDGGLLATLQSGYYLDRSYQSQIYLWGSDGWLKTDLANGLLQSYSNQNGRIEKFVADLQIQSNPYPEFVQAAIDSVREGTPPPVTSQESLQALKVVFGLYQAASNGLSRQIL
jgi:UDP-N-acetyl-2-amino-2-deoxyglucuronate dehydrogenase